VNLSGDVLSVGVLNCLWILVEILCLLACFKLFVDLSEGILSVGVLNCLWI
jgi:hypothetical protein